MNGALAKTAAFVVNGALGMASGFAIARSTYPPLDVLVSSSKTIIGQNFHYPEGTAKITGAIVTMQPGDTTGWHKHDAPLFAWMIEGQLTVDYGADGVRTYNKGDAFIEAFESYHNGKNTGDGVARVLAVFAGADGVANTVMKDN
jgi:quercetin dioxygenase-like cupin family protein